MLPRARRVTRKLFDGLLKGSQALHSAHFSLRLGHASDPKEPSRFSVVVSSQVLKKSHDRNLLKRRTRAAIHAMLPFVKNGYTVVFFAKKTSAGLNFIAISNEVDALLRKAGIVLV